MEINKFLKNKQTEYELIELEDVVPDFLLSNDDIFSEIKKLDKDEVLELFNGIFLSLNQLGEKIFLNNTGLTYIDEFKQKIINYNPKALSSLEKLNDLVLSDMIGIIEHEFKENGIKPFFNDKFDLRVKKIKKSIF